MNLFESASRGAGIALSESQRFSWLRLIRSENVGPATFRELINHFGSAQNALDALPDLAAQGRSKKAYKIAAISRVEEELERARNLGAQFVCLGEPSYPVALRAGDAPPPVLTVHGSLNALGRNCVAFVGSRNCSLAGIKLTKQLAADVANGGYVISSGLARGIDSAAHEASLQQGTIAVFAGGIDHIYPRENSRLANSIVENGGALISEMPFGWTPRAQDFPRRNRIVAGLALGLVVVEAARRSGSLISARLANEMGRTVFAVPGSPLDPRSEGANHLIKQGAQLITSANDILETLSPVSEMGIQSTYSLNETVDEDSDLRAPPTESDRERLLAALGHVPTQVDEILRFLEISPSVLQILLLELDLAGRLERHPGNCVSLI